MKRTSGYRGLALSRPTISLLLESLENRWVPAQLAQLYVPGEVLIQFTGNEANLRDHARSVVSGELTEIIDTPLMQKSGTSLIERIHIPANESVDAAIARLSQLPGVARVEPNWILTDQSVSNDPYYTVGSLWGMYGPDSPVASGPSGTTNTFGSNAEAAWNAGYTGSSTVFVGVVDEGIQISHPDLVNNIWTNPYDPVDGVDNDGNGYVDDVNGWDFVNNDNTVYDGTGDDHATHVAGTIGGTGGNGIGVAGVNWNVTLISTKFLGPNGGTTADAIKAIDYLTDMKIRHGINLVATNNSWGGGGFSQGLQDAINRSAQQNILFVAAAGNGGTNNDATASYPANYSTLAAAGYEAVISVAAIDSAGSLASFSQYGATTVDIGAPGVGIYSTLPSSTGSTYGSYSGTSMATPHVTGAVALFAAANPTATAAQIRTAILASATPTASLAGKTVTGGRLNVGDALAGGIVNPPPVVPSISIANASKSEGNSGTSTLSFTVTLSAATTSNVTFNFATASGTATSGSDFVAASGTGTILAGQLSTTVSVTINGDTTYESNETFKVNLSGISSNAVAGTTSATGTIVNDDKKGGGRGLTAGAGISGHSVTSTEIAALTLSTGLGQAGVSLAPSAPIVVSAKGPQESSVKATSSTPTPAVTASASVAKKPSILDQVFALKPFAAI